MRALPTGLLFLAPALSAVAAAQSGTAGDTRWTALDQDLDQLVLSARSEDDGLPTLSGILRAEFNANTRAPQDRYDSDFRILNAILALEGDIPGSSASYRISYEMGEAPVLSYSGNTGPGGGSGTLEDAYVTMPLPGDLQLTVGQFKAPVLRSGLVMDDRTLFFQYSFLGSIFEVRDQGVMLEGKWDDRLRAAIAVQDGVVGGDDDHAFVGRVAFDLAGTGVPLVEGAYGAPEELCATIAAAVLEDKTISDGVLIAFEGAMTYDRLSVAAELVTAEDGYDDQVVVDSGDFRSQIGNATPWGVTASYMLRDDFEAAYRIDFLDTPDDRHVQTLGGTYYLDGHDLKWQFGVSVDERDGRDVHTFGLGISASF